MKQKIDDLEVSLVALDKGKKGYTSFIKGMNQSESAAAFLGSTLRNGPLAASVALGAALTALTIQGRDTAVELRQLGATLGTTTQEADALYSVFQDTNPLTSIEGLSDGLLTLSERFTEGRVASGELFNFAKDFGLDANFAVEGARAQTVEFLRVLRQLPSETDRVSTAIAVMGDEGARQFIPMLRDLDKLESTMISLGGAVENIPDIYTQKEAEDIDEYVKAAGEVRIAWEGLGKSVFNLFVEEMTFLAEGLKTVIDSAKTVIDFVDGAQESIFDGLTQGGTDVSTKNFIDNEIEKNELKLRLEGVRGRGLRKKVREGYNEELRLQEERLRNENEFMSARERRQTESVGQYGFETEARRLTAEREAAEARQKQYEAEEKAAIERQKQIQAARDSQAQAEFERRDANSNIFAQRRADADPVQGDFDPEQAKAKELERFRDGLLDISDTGRETAEVFGMMAGSLDQFISTLNGTAKKEFEIFKGLQIGIATASALSGAAQALADWKTSSGWEKLAIAGKVAAYGLGLVAQIRKVTASGASSSGAPPVDNTSPQAPPQALAINSEGVNGDVININVQGEKVTVSELQEMAERMSRIPNLPLMVVTGGA